MSDKDVSITIKLKDAASAGLKSMESAADKVREKFFDLKEVMGMAAGALEAFTLGVVIKDMIELGVATDKTFRQIAANLPSGIEGIHELKEGIAALAIESGRSLEEMHAAAAGIAKLGVSGAEELQQQLTAATLLSDATGTDLTASAELLVQLRREFHLTGEQALETAAQLASVSQGRVSLDELMGAFRRASPQFQKFQIDAETGMRAIVSLVAEHGLAARQVGQELNKLDGAGIRQLAAEAKLSATAMADLQQRADLVRQSAENTGAGLKAKFTDVLEDLGTTVLPLVIGGLKVLSFWMDVISGKGNHSSLPAYIAELREIGALAANSHLNIAPGSSQATSLSAAMGEMNAAFRNGSLDMSKITADDAERIRLAIDQSLSLTRQLWKDRHNGSAMAVADIAAEKAQYQALYDALGKIQDAGDRPAEAAGKAKPLPMSEAEKKEIEAAKQKVAADLVWAEKAVNAFSDATTRALAAGTKDAAEAAAADLMAYRDQYTALRAELEQKISALPAKAPAGAREALEARVGALDDSYVTGWQDRFAAGAQAAAEQVDALKGKIGGALSQLTGSLGQDAQAAITAQVAEWRRAVETNTTLTAAEKETLNQQITAWQNIKPVVDKVEAAIARARTTLGSISTGDQGYSAALADLATSEHDVTAAMEQMVATGGAQVTQSKEYHAAEQELAAIQKARTGIVDELLTRSQKFLANQKDLADTIEHDLLRAMERFATKGATSWRAFFQEASQLSTQFTAALEANIAKQAALLADATTKHDSALAASIKTEIAHLKTLMTAAHEAATVIDAGMAGYQVGEQSGNSTKGALGGAASGAAMGAEFGPWGAVAGGLIGAAAGLFGAAAEHRKAAAALQKAAEAAQLSLMQYNVKAGLGGTTAPDVSKAENHAEANKLYDAIDAALPGLKNQVEREKELAQVRADEAAITEKLANAESTANARAVEDLQVRQLEAQGRSDEATALRAQLEMEDALTAKRSAEYIVALQLAESLEAAAAATKKANGAFFEQADADWARVQQQRAAANQAAQDAKSAADAEAKSLDDSRREATDALAKQKTAVTDLIRTQTQAAQDQQRFAAASHADTLRALESLRAFRGTLDVGPLSVLSPLDQKRAAESKMNALFEAARNGDKDAASAFGEAAKTFVELSQGYNASGPGFVAEQAGVQQMTDALIAQYGAQESIEQQALDAANRQVDLLAQQLDAIGAASDAISEAIKTASGDQIGAIGGAIQQLGSTIVAAIGGTLAGSHQDISEVTRRPYPASIVGVENRRDYDIAMRAGQTGDLTDYNANIAQRASDFAVTQAGAAHTPYEEAWAAWLQSHGGNVDTHDAFEEYYFSPERHEQFDVGGWMAPHFALGGMFDGGVRLVGERGPELEFTGPSRILSHSQTRELLAGLGGGVGSAELLGAITDGQAEIVAVLQAGFKQVIAGNDRIITKLDDNAAEMRRGFERLGAGR